MDSCLRRDNTEDARLRGNDGVGGFSVSSITPTHDDRSNIQNIEEEEREEQQQTLTGFTRLTGLLLYLAKNSLAMGEVKDFSTWCEGCPGSSRFVGPLDDNRGRQDY